MQNLLDAKFDQFIEDFKLLGNSKDTNWNRFVNYHFFSQFQPGRFDTDADLLDQICVDSPEFSEIRGALFLLNDQILSNPKDIDDILQRDQKGQLELYFLGFGDEEALMQQLEKLFASLDAEERREDWIQILSYAMSRKIVLRWKDNPVLKVVIYSNNGNTDKINFKDIFYHWFSDIASIRINEKRLQGIIHSNENNYQAELELKSASLIPGGEEKYGNAYITCMSAQELIKLTVTSDGLLRRNMFDDNVRDFQGDSSVTQEIMSTLEKFPERFVLFNNGITIVCKNIAAKNGKYVLDSPQIVNGCQTCNMVYRAYRNGVNLNGVQIITKIVGSDLEAVTQGIVKGANRQNIVYEQAFETIREFHKNLEKYFEINEVHGYQKIYYERRARQYVNNFQIKPQQIISFRGLIQSMAALFLNHVENSHRHEYKLLKEYKDSLFVDVHSYQPYYLSALLYLNIDRLFREGKLPKRLHRFKMHIMLLVKEMKCGPSPELASDDIDKYCEQLHKSLEGGKLMQMAEEACEKFENIADKWIDLKGPKYQYGMKDSAEFRRFLMKEIHGISNEKNEDRLYTGNVMNVNLDKRNTLYGFIEHAPDNIFFHEFDNPDMNQSYAGKRVSYKIIRNGSQERAINVKLVESQKEN